MKTMTTPFPKSVKKTFSFQKEGAWVLVVEFNDGRRHRESCLKSRSQVNKTRKDFFQKLNGRIK